jgi:hypothetical protein
VVDLVTTVRPRSSLRRTRTFPLASTGLERNRSNHRSVSGLRRKRKKAR